MILRKIQAKVGIDIGGKLESEGKRERHTHPETRRFVFEYDRDRRVIVVFDKGIAGEISLDDLLANAPKQPSQ